MSSFQHVLVVDDSKVIANLLEITLSREGFSVAVAANSEQAYERIRERLPDLILLDLYLPDVHGLNLCEMLKADDKTRLIPIIMMTAMATEPHDKVIGLKAGADDYVTKPFNLPELVERVRAVLRRV